MYVEARVDVNPNSFLSYDFLKSHYTGTVVGKEANVVVSALLKRVRLSLVLAGVGASEL